MAASIAGLAGGYNAWRSLSDRSVAASQDRFRSIRTQMQQNTRGLSDVAADLHVAADPRLHRIGPSAMLSAAGLQPPAPVPLSDVEIDWDGNETIPNPKLLTLSQHVLPKRTRWAHYQRYSAALEALARPGLFENRLTFRLLRADWSNSAGPRLLMGPARYFDLIDEGEAFAHELSAAMRSASPRTPKWRALPMRASIRNDPLAFQRRHALPSIGTLTIRRAEDGTGTFFLLHRSPGQVATGGGEYNVIPGGMFQPASISPVGYRRDLSLWRNVMREYNEEMLGAPEAGGDSGAEVDYTQPPYSEFEQALMSGALRIWSLGLGVEALNLVPCLLTIAVWEASTFERIFGGLVDRNSEGTLISGPRTGNTIGLPLTPDVIDDLERNAHLGSIASACLHLARLHRDVLLRT